MKRLLSGLAVILLVLATVMAVAPRAKADPMCDEFDWECMYSPIPEKAQVAVPQAELNRFSGYINEVAQDLGHRWTAYMNERGLPDLLVGYYIINRGEGHETKCAGGGYVPKVVTSDFPNAFYCAQDSEIGADSESVYGSLILPLETLYEVMQGNLMIGVSAIPGDFAAAFVVAHEYGHAVTIYQYLMRVEEGLPEPENMELLADCYAGVWSGWAYEDGQVTDHDLMEAIAATRVIGSSGHGTGEDRELAYKTGLNSEQPSKCVSSYWK